MEKPWRKSSGQNITETIVLFPLYFMLVFGLLQMGQLATALLVANYAAAAIARQAVQDGGKNTGSYDERFRGLLTAGMKESQVAVSPATGTFLGDITVNTCARVDAYPFVNYFVKHAITPFMGHYTSPDAVACEESIPNSIGPFYYHRQIPYYFVVHGKAKARMNYR